MTASTGRRALRIAFALLASSLLVSCGGARPPVSQGPVFPPPPAAPRLQFLTQLSAASDVTPRRGPLARLVLGEEQVDDGPVKPYGLAIHDGVVYVCDTKRNLVNLFDLRGRRFGYLGFEGPGRLRKPINVRVGEDGTKYVADAERHEIVTFGPDDAYRGAFGADELKRPVDVALANGRVYVCDAETCEIVVFDRSTREPLSRFGGKGTEPGKFARPTNLAVDGAGNVYVSDTINGRVQKCDAEGKPLQTIGGLGTALGKLARPKGIDVDPEGRIYVVDAAFDNVQIFDPDGRLLLFFGEAGDGPGQFQLPTQVVVDRDAVDLFREYAAPGFRVEYVVLVASQFGPRKVSVFGFGEAEATP